MKRSPLLNPLVFVSDENDAKFRAHIAARAKEAEDTRNRLPLSELKKQLAKRNTKKLDA